ncbi:MAG: hypothetical protein QMC81_02910 [Thermoanaerobacterales bacterium]|nr:hypothetical protein [Thermoanaerobacterales bacterium]
MLGKIGMALVTIWLLVGIGACLAITQGMMTLWHATENQAQFLAISQGRYGGYTTEADEAMRDFCHDLNLDCSEIEVAVSAPGGPVPWGTVVTAKVTVPFKFQLGSFLVPFEVPLTGYGRSVSTYLPGSFDVTYTWPS